MKGTPIKEIPTKEMPATSAGIPVASTDASTAYQQ